LADHQCYLFTTQFFAWSFFRLSSSKEAFYILSILVLGKTEKINLLGSTQEDCQGRSKGIWKYLRCLMPINNRSVDAFFSQISFPHGFEYPKGTI
jgi:hypothetical protein